MDEVFEFLKRNDPTTKKSEAAKTFEDMDKDGDGKVDYEVSVKQHVPALTH